MSNKDQTGEKYEIVLMQDKVIVPNLILVNRHGEQWYGNCKSWRFAQEISRKLEREYGEEFFLYDEKINPLEILHSGEVRNYKKIMPGISIWGKCGLATRCSTLIKKTMIGCNANLHC